MQHRWINAHSLQKDIHDRLLCLLCLVRLRLNSIRLLIEENDSLLIEENDSLLIEEKTATHEY